MKMKKKIGISVATLIGAGAATAIAVPVALYAQKKTDVIAPVDQNGGAYIDVEGKLVLVDELKNINDVQNKNTDSFVANAWTSTKQFLYDKEQGGSLKLQAMNFKYDFYILQLEDDKLDDESKAVGTSQSRKDTIRRRRDEIKTEQNKLNDKINKVENNTVDYSAADFSVEYPDVLMSRQILIERKKDIIKDQESSFIEKYTSDEAGGRAAWIEERKKLYDGALSNDQAAINDVNKEIESESTSQYMRKLNSSYTARHAIAEYNGSVVYPFLQDAIAVVANKPGNVTVDKTGYTYKNNGSDVEFSDTIYFLSTESKDPQKILVSLDGSDETIIKLADKGLINVKHALLKITQDEKLYNAPWKISKDTVKKLFGFHGPNSIDGTGATKNIDLLTDLFSSSDTSLIKTKKFIRDISDNSDLTKYKTGDLGTKTTLEMLKGLSPGFAIGLLQASLFEKNSKSTASQPLPQGIHISDDGLDRLEKIQKIKDGDFGNNNDLDNFINRKTDEEIQNEFGDTFPDIMSEDATHKGIGYAYHIKDGSGNKDGRYMFISKDGIHVVKIELTDETKLISDIKEDMKKSSEEQDSSLVKNDYSEMFKPSLTNDRVINKLINDSDYITWLFNNIDDRGNKTEVEIKSDLESYIIDEINSESIKMANNIFTSSMKDYIVQSYNKKLRTMGTGTYGPSLKEIYGWIEFLAKKEAV